MKSYVLVSLMVFALLVSPIMAVTPEMPKIPMSIECSSITINGDPAAVGTTVAAHGENVYTGSIVTTTQYGKWNGDTQLVIQGIPVKGQGQYPIPEGSPITFTIGSTSLKVRLTGTTAWLDSIPYYSGTAPVIELYSGESPVVIPESTPRPTPVPTQIPTTTPTPAPTYVPQPTQSRPDNVRVYYTNFQLPQCGSGDTYVPEGYGVLRVSAGSSNGQFYLNGALITNAGVTILKGIRPGIYHISYRERYYEPEEIDVEVIRGRVTNVEVTPEGPGLLGIIGWPPDWSKDTAPDISENIYPYYYDLPDRSTPSGSFTVMTYFPGTTIWIDDDSYAGCDIPCDFTFDGLSPGIHTIRYVTGEYESTFPAIICAGTVTRIGGGTAVRGYSCNTGSCTYIPALQLYRGVETLQPIYTNYVG